MRFVTRMRNRASLSRSLRRATVALAGTALAMMVGFASPAAAQTTTVSSVAGLATAFGNAAAGTVTDIRLVPGAFGKWRVNPQIDIAGLRGQGREDRAGCHGPE